MNSTLQKELALRDLPVIFRRRRKIVYGAVAAIGIPAILYCALATSRYEALGTIQVQAKSLDKLGLENMQAGSEDSSASEPDSLTATMNIMTQVDILKSETLALKTIGKLNLEGTQDFKAHSSPMIWVRGLFGQAQGKDATTQSLTNSPYLRRRALEVFRRNLSVNPVVGTRLINISYLNPDPKLAAEVVNTLMQSLIDYSFQTRFDATNQAATWLSGRLADLRRQSEELQRQVAEKESKSGVYSLGTPDPRGRDQAYSGVLDQLQQATAALTQAEQNRILREAILRATENGDAEMISSLAGNSTNGSAVNNSFALIQNLRAQEGTQEAALQQAEAKFGPAYPKLAEIRSNLAGLRQSIQQETERVKGRAKNDYEDAVRDEAATRSQYNKIKAQADSVNDKAMDLAILRQESDQSRKLYQELLQRFNEAGVLEGLKGSTIAVVDPGLIPDRAKTPNVPRYMATALGGGFLLGCFLALLAEVMDAKLYTIDEARRISGASLLGVTPQFPVKSTSQSYDGAISLASLSDPQSPFIEATRAIRTKILMNPRGDRSKVIFITSSVPREGKTTISSNLAVLLAQSGKKVLIVDTDLRMGAMHVVLDLPSGAGLSELLAGESPEPRLNRVSGVPNLDALQAGSVPMNPSELLGSGSLDGWLSTWRQSYDYIVLDSAPLLPVTDSLSLLPVSDMVLLIARSGLTSKSELAASHQLLTNSTRKSVGVILNGLQPQEEGYSTYFAYRRQPTSKYAIAKGAN